jgi:hypothetical protein
MKVVILFSFLISSVGIFAQLDKLDLKNLVVVAQLDRPEDRFTAEINFAEIFANVGIKTMASLNAQKQGADIAHLAYDSIQKAIAAKGFDTYVLISVRGYDNKFKAATMHNDLKTELGVGHLFPLYRDEIASVTFEFNFYRNGQFVAYDMIKIGGIASRDEVVKKLRKKMPKRIAKYWL